MAELEAVGPDPEAMRMGKELEAALIVASAPGGAIAPAIAIADQIVARGLVSSPRSMVLAMWLVELTFQHLAARDPKPDPYARLAQHLVRIDVCTQLDLEAAYLGRVLNTGLTQGWLDAELYDHLAAVGGNDATYQRLLSTIERRETNHG